MLLHAHVHEKISAASFMNEVVLHTILDTLKLIPLLFLTYLLMEFIEHRASGRTSRFLEKSGPLAPAVGAFAGLLPQCGFSASAANLYTGRVITMGTLVAVFLSTSDEMIPILVSGDIPVTTIVYILAYKLAVAILVGLSVEAVFRIFKIKREPINIDEICDEDNCHCERGIFYSALHHTVTISAFVLAITLLLNCVIFFVGQERIGQAVGSIPVLSHLIASVVGLIPNCAASVALATFAKEGIISAGAMLAGLFSGAGVGLLVLFRLNKKLKQNLLIVLILVLTGTLFGFIADFIPFLRIS
jgi:hypothetical protein